MCVRHPHFLKETIMSTLYHTKVTAVGGRGGTVRSEDGLLDLQLALPTSLGGKGGATNPEQLFAAGYAACFGNAVIHVTRGKTEKVKDGDIVVAAEVGLSPNASGGFVLSVALDVTITGLDQASAEAIVAAAHAVCPYSNAVKGNIDVKITVTTR
jgi:Ohr subfamily peroxiredoxin